jgi:hypothetical protein
MTAFVGATMDESDTVRNLEESIPDDEKLTFNDGQRVTTHILEYIYIIQNANPQ